jgi:hypothetical protein
MCLIKVKKVEDEEDYEAVRRRRRVYRRDRASIVVPQPSGYPVLPPPQPIPMLSSPPILPVQRTDVQHIVVSRPSSSSSSSHHEHRDVRYSRREVRYERDNSPERHHEYRYVNAPESLSPEPRRQRSRSRRRSTSRRRDDYYDDEIRVKTKKTYYD